MAVGDGHFSVDSHGWDSNSASYHNTQSPTHENFARPHAHGGRPIHVHSGSAPVIGDARSYGDIRSTDRCNAKSNADFQLPFDAHCDAVIIPNGGRAAHVNIDAHPNARGLLCGVQ